jgi:hypothetical protein
LPLDAEEPPQGSDLVQKQRVAERSLDRRHAEVVLDWQEFMSYSVDIRVI